MAPRGLRAASTPKAMADFNDSIRLDPQNAVAYYARGYAWHQRGQHEKAIADYNEAITVNPKDVGISNAASPGMN